ncbi:hypothetical protein [Providencia huaxiensis]
MSDLFAPSLIEVRSGNYLQEDDIIRLEEYGAKDK